MQFASGNAMAVLGIRPAIGRILTPADDLTRGAHPVALLSHAFWSRRFAGDPAIVGKWITVEQTPLQIVGVAEAGFTGVEPGMLTDLWASNMMWASGQPLDNPQWNWLRVWGRLAPGVERRGIAPALQTTHSTLEGEIAVQEGRTRGGEGGQVVLDVRPGATGVSAMRDTFRRPLVVLAGLVVAVLLIACANVATLLIARAAGRDGEMALRASIGAGRGQLLQQLLAEAGLLTAAAAGLGVLIARAAAPLIVAMITRADNPVHLDTALDTRALIFLLALTALTTTLFGLGPALRASRAKADGALGRMAGRYGSQPRGLRWLVSVQVAFSLSLVFVAGLLLQSFDRLTRIDLGFVAERIVLVEVADARPPDAGRHGQRRPPAARRRSARAGRRRRQPVELGALSRLVVGWELQPAGRRPTQTNLFEVSPGFFETMRIPLVHGRELEAADLTAGMPQAVVVNETFARRYFRGQAAVGQVLERRTDEGVRRYRIVGVAANARDIVVTNEIGRSVFPPWMNPNGVVQVRTSLAPREVASRLRTTLTRVHPSLRITDVTTQSSLVAGTLMRERLLAVLSAFFAGVGLALAAVGLYGVSSYAVVRRTREIGIRLALGAGRATVVRAVLGRIAVALAVGLVAGLAGGVYFSRLLAHAPLRDRAARRRHAVRLAGRADRRLARGRVAPGGTEPRGSIRR